MLTDIRALVDHILMGLPNINSEQSTPMRSDPMNSGGRVQLNIDLSASAMSGFVFQNFQVPPNWWGYGMPPEDFANSSGTSQVADLVGKAPMTSAPPVSPMTQIPQYSKILLQGLLLVIFKHPHSRCLMQTDRQIHYRLRTGL